MIRTFVLLGVVGGLIVAYLTTFGVGPTGQLPPPESLLTKFRAEGVVPKNVDLAIDETPEDLSVFQVPQSDEEKLKEAEASYEKMLSGMNMDMGSGDGKMDMGSGDGKMDMGSDNAAMNSDNAAMNGGNGSMNSGNGSMNMASGEMPKAEGGLMFMPDGPYDREITLTMSEWKFDKMKIDVKPGERIKFTVKNGGQIPHEFMFMSPPLMNAVKYRATRADWNLFEHEALYERALVLPGGEFSFVMQVQQPGTWMFMCMLPYHMEMGMMGQMATKGMAMDM